MGFLFQRPCEVLRSNAGVQQWHKRFGFRSCDPAVSANAGRFDLDVMSLDAAGYQVLRAGRSGRDLAAIALAPHPFDSAGPISP